MRPSVSKTPLLLAALAVCAVARGQDTPDGPPVAPALTESRAPLRDAFAWEPVGHPVGARMSDLAVHPFDPNLVAATTLSGEVWLSLDAGVSWFRVLDGLAVHLGQASNDEDVQQQLEAHLQDVLEIDDAEDLEEGLSEDEIIDIGEDLQDRARQAAEEAAEQVRADLEVQADFLIDDALLWEQDEVLAGRLDAARPRVWFSEDGWLLVGRADGLWLSTDVAESFRHVLDVAVTALAWLPSRQLWVAGTRDGVRFSTDAVAWIDADDGTEDLHIYDLAAAPEGIYAGTAVGLWFAPDAQRWEAVGTLFEPVLAVLPDPDWPGGLWQSTLTGVLRSDDGGASERPRIGASLPGVVSIERLAPGHLLVAGSEGPWESLDGGTTWLPVNRGLSDPDARDVEAVGDAVLLASDEGILRLVPRAPDDPLATTGPALADLVAGFVPVSDLIGAALGRRGLDEGALTLGTRVLFTMIPELRVEGRYQPGDRLAYTTTSGTSRDDDGTFTVFAVATWTPDGRKNGGGNVDADTDSEDVETGVTTAMIGDDVWVSDGSDASLMSARVVRNGSAYRQSLAEDITAMYYARVRLLQERPRIARESLRARLEHELDVREIEARLDVLTEGAVSRWYASKERGTP